MRIAIFVIISFSFFACGNKEQLSEQSKVFDNDSLSTLFEHANKALREKEEREIEDFIARYGWDMKETGTGLRYLIYYHGNGKERAKPGMIATINFEVMLINGQVCYTSKEDGTKQFLIEKADIESGLHEGIQLMSEGDKAKLIIPSHLAFGLPGDQNKIPKRATLIYDVELVKLQ
jgi:FKBP-type peptidyl-prolyl cis-trans isomerase